MSVHRVWCYTQRDATESAVRAVGTSVMRAASQHGASVWVRCAMMEETETAVAALRRLVGSSGIIDIHIIAEPQEADLHMEVRVGELAVAVWHVGVFQKPHVATSAPDTSEFTKLVALIDRAGWSTQNASYEEASTGGEAVKEAVTAGVRGIADAPKDVTVHLMLKRPGDDTGRRWCTVSASGKPLYVTGFTDVYTAGGFTPSDATYGHGSGAEWKARAAFSQGALDTAFAALRAAKEGEERTHEETRQLKTDLAEAKAALYAAIPADVSFRIPTFIRQQFWFKEGARIVGDVYYRNDDFDNRFATGYWVSDRAYAALHSGRIWALAYFHTDTVSTGQIRSIPPVLPTAADIEKACTLDCGAWTGNLRGDVTAVRNLRTTLAAFDTLIQADVTFSHDKKKKIVGDTYYIDGDFTNPFARGYWLSDRAYAAPYKKNPGWCLVYIDTSIVRTGTMSSRPATPYQLQQGCTHPEGPWEGNLRGDVKLRDMALNTQLYTAIQANVTFGTKKIVGDVCYIDANFTDAYETGMWLSDRAYAVRYVNNDLDTTVWLVVYIDTTAAFTAQLPYDGSNVPTEQTIIANTIKATIRKSEGGWSGNLRGGLVRRYPLK
jgi:hypothetical protein